MRQRVTCAFVALLVLLPVLATAQASTPPPSLSVADAPAGSRPSQSLDTVGGSFVSTIPIEAPAFHGIEPRLSLVYSSPGGNGFTGVGWRLTGWTVLERTRTGRGTPRFTASDVFVLDGQPLVPCGEAPTSPGCAAGGTHATKRESHSRIRFDAASNSWTLWAPSGVKAVLEPVLETEQGTLRWGLARVSDPSGNAVSYTWDHLDGEAYPSRIGYGPYEIRLHRDPDPRPDTVTSGTAGSSGLARMRHRLGSIVVARGAAAIRAYRLGYAASAETARSLLSEVQLYGLDVEIDAAGRITRGAGTYLPAQSFRYQGTE